MRRNLSAVLAADVAGYSRLMSDNAELTLATLRRLRSEVLGPAVAAKHGRVVKSMGDGWIVIFKAISDAVECAMQVQDRLKIDGAMSLRMGIHLGDIAEADDDVFGDGVNIAARLQTLAEPGALVISGAAQALLDGTLRPSFDSAGERELKNIATPVPVWVRGGEIAGGKATMETRGLPRLAIRPVGTMDPRDEVREMAMALTGDLAAHLNALRSLSSRTTEAPKSDDYRLTTTLRTHGDRIRLEARLVAPGGGVVLSKKYDGSLAEAFDWQDETGLTVAQDTFDGLMADVITSFDHLSDEECSARQLYLRMMTLGLLDGSSLVKMTDLMSLAIEKDPEWGLSYAYAAAGTAAAITSGQKERVSHHLAKLPEWSAKVQELEPAHSPARIVLAFGDLVRTGEKRDAMRNVRVVLRNLPFDPEALIWGAWTFCFCDEAQEAINCLDKSDRSIKTPVLAASACNAKAMSYFLLGDYATAMKFTEKTLKMSPDYNGALMVAAATHAMAGEERIASRFVARVLELSPDYTLRRAGWRGSEFHRPGIAAYFEGLKKAGMPE